MRERPILFSTSMVQAILAGRKTQTRRVVKFPLKCPTHHVSVGNGQTPPPTTWCPYGKVGDVLWVRENFCFADSFDNGKEVRTYAYQATPFTNLKVRWKPSIHMPKAACRIFLRITNVRVERLQDISESDAISEGVEKQFTPLFQEWRYKDYFNINSDWRSPISSFQSLWASINGIESWDNNPWVWVVEFERIVK